MPDWKSEIEKRLAGSHLVPAVEADLSEELAQHLEDRYRELLSGGGPGSTSPAAARAAVLAELRNLEEVRAWLPASRRRSGDALVAGGGPGDAPSRGSLLADFARDLRYGWRVMGKAPVLTLFAVLSLGLGIGANTTVFTIINTLLLQPLPVREPSRLVVLYETGGKGSRQGGSRLPLSYANFDDYAAGQRCLRGIAAFTPPMVLTLRGDAGPERLFGEFATQQYFDALGLRPAAGRFFLPEEDSQAGSAAVAVLSYKAWKLRFGGSAEVIGRTLEVNHIAFTVVGVAPEGFLGLSAIFGPDVWMPATMSERAFPAEFANALSDRAKPLFHVAGRLNPGFTMPRAQAQLETISAALAREYPEANEGRAISVRPVAEELFSNVGGAGGVAFGSAVLLAIVALVLGIACSNVANLLLARAAARGQEMAVRLAIGAHRGRLIRQMLAESGLLSLRSGVAGLAIGYAGCRLVWLFVPAEVARNMATPRLDGNVLLFAVLVSLATAFVFGLAPALRTSKTDVATGLKEGPRTAVRSRRRVTFANALLVGQVAFSLVCLITAALFFRSIQRAYTINPGFDTKHLAVFMLNPAQAGYSETRVKDFYRAARERVSALPGVAAVSWASGLPFWHSPSRPVMVEGLEQRKKSEAIPTVAFTVDTGYFETMGIAPVGGRVFRDSDDDRETPVAIVNRTLAEEYWPGGGAIGHRFQFAGDKVWRQVIGVVETANYTSLGEAPQPCVYLPLRQNFAEGMVLHVRGAGDPAYLLGAVQGEIRRLDPNIEAGDARTGAKLIQQMLWGPMVGVALLGVFGGLALALANVGLYGVMAYTVVQRRKEIGLRMALGAPRPAVLGLILREGMAMVSCGIVVGLAASLLVGRVLSRMLFGISSGDPVSLAAATVVLIAIALLACYLPARSATRIDPMVALREG